MKLRRSFPPMAVAAALLFAGCGGGSSSSDADVQREIDEGVDLIAESADDIVTTTTAADEPASSEAPITDPPGTDPPVTAPDAATTCGNKIELGEYGEVECDEPHDSELVSLLPPPQQNAPQDAQDREFLLTELCLPDVAAFTGEDLSLLPIEVGFVSPTPAGESFEDNVECWVTMTAENTLVGSIAEVGLDAALGDVVFLQRVAMGDCYSMVDEQEDSFDMVRVAPCDEEGVEQIVGRAVLEDRPYPGKDAVVDESFALCDAEVLDTDLEMISGDVAIVYPDEIGWTVHARRTLECVAYVETAADGTFCAIQIPSEGHDEEPCDQPHDSEFAGSIAPPAETLPDDPFVAEVLMTEHCARTVSDYLDGRDLSTPGVGVGFEANTGLGEVFDVDVNCYAVAGSPVALNAAIASVGLEAALGEFSILAELDPGTCFEFAPESFDIGIVVTCDTPEALMSVGKFDVDDDGPHPGDDELRAIRFERCSEILVASGLSADPASVSGTFPGDVSWTALGRRTITCDATPL